MNINNEQDYQQALIQYEIVKQDGASIHHKMKLVKAISDYENSLWDLPKPTENKFDENKF